VWILSFTHGDTFGILQLMAGEDQFLFVADVARRSGFSLKTVYRAIDSGALVASQPTSRYLVTEAEYQRWVSSGRHCRGAARPVELSAPATPPIQGSLDELLAIEREPV